MQTVYEAAGGGEGMLRLAAAWHSRVMADEVVSHAFSHGFHPEHIERLAAYWAVTEQGHVTAVKAGENRGVTLQHDFVVREYQTVPAWSARAGAPQSLAFELAARSDATRPREVNLVVVDAESGRPVQAVKLGC